MKMRNRERIRSQGTPISFSTEVYFLGRDDYLFVASVSRGRRTARRNALPQVQTSLDAALQSASRLSWASDRGCRWNEMTCHRAAAGGYLEALKCARREGCVWDTRACNMAAVEAGHQDIMQGFTATVLRVDEHTCHTASKRGQLDFLEWCRAKGAPGTALHARARRYRDTSRC